jgi:glycosyltransferase involved in cell wall biosynthesis
VITGALLAQAIDARGEWDTITLCNSAGPVLDYHHRLGVACDSLREATGLPYRPKASDGNRIRRIAKRLFLILAARRYLKRMTPAIIHVHDESSALAWGLAARGTGIPVVWQVHQQLPQVWVDWLLRRLAAHIVLVSANNQRRFAGRAIPPCSVIYNGVDRAVFYPAESRGTGSVTVGFISNLVDRKRPDWVVRAVAILARQGHDANVLLAGNDFSNGAQAKALADLAAHEGIVDRFRYLGPRSDVPDLLRGLDVLALPSERDKEAFPRIIVEAMACGVPVVATAVAGIPEAVVDGETGALVDPDDFSAFVEALRRIVADADLRRRYGAVALARSAALFSMEANVTAVLRVYDQVSRDPAPVRRIAILANA